MNIRLTPRLGSTVIDGATCEAWRHREDRHAYLLYQARRENGELKWWVSYMLKADDGYTGETIWATSADEAFALIRAQLPMAHFPDDAVHADCGRKPVGWSAEQQGRAVVWCVNTFSDEAWTKKIAKMFAATRAA